jgi:hypothetical protein
MKSTDDGAGMLLNLMRNHLPELEVEIQRTEEHEFREEPEKQEKFLQGMIAPEPFGAVGLHGRSGYLRTVNKWPTGNKATNGLIEG